MSMYTREGEYRAEAERLRAALAAKDTEIARLRVARGASRALARYRLRVIDRQRQRVELAEATIARVEAALVKAGRWHTVRVGDNEVPVVPVPAIRNALAQPGDQEGTGT